MSRWSSAERRRRGGILTGLVEVMLVDDIAVRSFRVRGGVRSRKLLCGAEAAVRSWNCRNKLRFKVSAEVVMLRKLSIPPMCWVGTVDAPPQHRFPILGTVTCQVLLPASRIASLV
jgi:hypothetical protein